MKQVMIFPVRHFFRTEHTINEALREFEDMSMNVLDVKIINLGTRHNHVMIVYE